MHFIIFMMKEKKYNFENVFIFNSFAKVLGSKNTENSYEAKLFISISSLNIFVRYTI